MGTAGRITHMVFTVTPMSSTEPVALPSCAVASCDEPRSPGGQFCVRHGKGGTLANIPAGPRPVTVAQTIRCPHCEVRGQVTTRLVKQKKGVSGGKATGAILTAGLSLFLTGLSRKEQVTELHCGSCGVTWHV